MGVEPTADTYAVPATDFEDRGAHRDTSTPICDWLDGKRLIRDWSNRLTNGDTCHFTNIGRVGTLDRAMLGSESTRTNRHKQGGSL